MINSKLSELSKSKLQKLNDECWMADELEIRKKQINRKSHLSDGSGEYKALQKERPGTATPATARKNELAKSAQAMNYSSF